MNNIKMISDCTCINAKTFEIEEKKYISVENPLAKTISILNKKGYYTEACNKAKISKPFLIGTIFQRLTEEHLLEVTPNTKDKIKKIMEEVDCEETFIIFKEKYSFDTLPKNYKIINKSLVYDLSILKDSDNIETKTLLELDEELKISLQSLEDWAKSLKTRI